ncbi:MAG: sugar porter family MFS transporter [Cellulomonadaceae bacterium]|jgi:sugar porter (SP) family MFS transporter|nr:sugar porter family MFS transporter [Cellulomonadaceae bacterium]
MSDTTTSAAASAANKKAIGLAVSAAVGGFLFGFDSSVINGAVAAVENKFNISAATTGFVVAIALLGCALGAWAGGRWADKWGRIKVMVSGAIIFFVSSLLSAFAWNAVSLGVFRFLAGIGIGIASVIAPAYIAEIAPARMRGRLGSLQQLAITVGIFAALLSDQLFAHNAGAVGEGVPIAAGEILGWPAWRWMFLVCIIPAAVYGILALRMPESPRFLVANGKSAEAKSVLASVLGPDEDVDQRLADIENTIESDKALAAEGNVLKETRPGKKGFLGLRKIVWIGIALSVFQQFVGINVIFYYSTILWKAVGFGEAQAFTVSTLTSITNVVVTFIAIALVDKIGRKPLLLIGSAGMAVTLGMMALAFTHSTGTGDNITLGGAWGVTALICANLFVVFFGATWGPVVWVLLGEMFPNRIRAAAIGLAAAFQWVANFLITVTFPPMLSAWGASVPNLLYAIFAALSFVFVLFMVRETKGKQLEEMEEH